MRWLLGIVLAGCAAGPIANGTPPHIVIFLADDLGYRDVGFQGGTIKTPHIDELARTGTRLDAFYVQPVCSPTRAAMLTGRYPIRMGLQVGVIRPHAKYGLALDEFLLPQALRRAGYETALCGKWHLGTLTPDYLPTRRGFDHQYGHYLGNINYFTHRRDGGSDWNRDDQPLQEAGYTTDLIGAESVRLIEAHDPQRPLFLYVAFNAPHTPLQVPAKWLDDYAHVPDQKRRTFMAMVACMDAAIGDVLQALERRGMRENTLVIFSSDNGGARQADNGVLRGRKGSVFEGGTRSPAVVNWPRRVPAGKVVDAPLHIVDLYPTLLHLAGGSTEGSKPLDGKNAWQTILGKAGSPHDDVLLNASRTRPSAIRAGDWKLVQQRRRGRQGRRAPDWMLFDLRRDPGEKTNVATAHPAKLAELRARLEGYQAAAAESLGGAGPMPKGKTPAYWGHPGR